MYIVDVECRHAVKTKLHVSNGKYRTDRLDSQNNKHFIVVEFSVLIRFKYFARDKIVEIGLIDCYC